MFIIKTSYRMLRYLVLAGLFYALTPGILLSVPKKASKNTVALTHAVVYAGVYYVAEQFFGLKEGFQSGSGLMEVPAGADPTTIFNIQTSNSSIIAAQMATEASTNGATTPLYLSLTAIKEQYDAAARAAQYAATAAANEAGSGSGRVAIAAPVSDAGSGPITGVASQAVVPKPKPAIRPKPPKDNNLDPNSPGAIAIYVVVGLLVVGGVIYYAQSSR